MFYNNEEFLNIRHDYTKHFILIITFNTHNNLGGSIFFFLQVLQRNWGSKSMITCPKWCAIKWKSRELNLNQREPRVRVLAQCLLIFIKCFLVFKHFLTYICRHYPNNPKGRQGRQLHPHLTGVYLEALRGSEAYPRSRNQNSRAGLVLPLHRFSFQRSRPHKVT